MFEITRFDEEEPQSEQRSPADMQQEIWFDNGIYKEWLIFLYRIWNSIEYL